MTVELLIALTTDLLEHEDFVSLDFVIENGGLHDSTINIGSSNLDSLIISDEKDLGELDISTFGFRESLNKDFVASLNFELLACNVYDCVH